MALDAGIGDTLDDGMFSTRSSVTQLRPETVSQCVQEAEETEWGRGDLNTYFPQEEPLVPSLGVILLSHSGSIKKIHNYFSQLESRKCCLHLACRRTTINSIRVVVHSQPRDDGSGKKSRPTSEVQGLENEELRAFKHAYLCAVYPVLAAPNPPSPVSPTTGLSDSAITSSTVNASSSTSSSSSNHQHHSIYGPNHSSNINDKGGTTEAGRPSTPYSLHDSGVEESEEAGLIPMESICEQLQRAFQLPRSVFRHYENMIIKTYAKKTSQKLLAEELCGQLVVLERGNHPFYNPDNFITQNGYDLWQKQERAHISCLLNKFWHTSLPFPADTQDLIAELHTMHKDYLILLKKLLRYESQFRQDSFEKNSTTFSSLSSASCRLLIEFGLRYGIGEIFQKIHFLNCLSDEFNLSVGYLSFINNLIHGIQQTLPRNKASVVMVREELSVLQATLRTLKVQSCKALTQMKSHFPNNKPAEGIELLLALLRVVLTLMRYLAPSGGLVPDFEHCLKTTIQSSFQPTYEKFKMVARNDLEESRETRVTPRLLNLLIQDVREDVSDYKNNFESTFQQYFSITGLASISYYQFLIEDVRNLSQGDVQHKPEQEIDLRMLALAYRLNQLEADWMPYIQDLRLSWRTLFLPSVDQWTLAMKIHMQNLMLEAVASDKFNSKHIELTRSSLRAYQASSNGSDQQSRSVSAMSFSPSVNSAFSSIVSGIVNNNYHPDKPYSLDGSANVMQDSIEERASQEKLNTLPDFGYEPVIKRQDSYLAETRSMTEKTSGEERVKPSPIRHQNSLPAKLNCMATRQDDGVFPFGSPGEASILESEELPCQEQYNENNNSRDLLSNQSDKFISIDNGTSPSPLKFIETPSLAAATSDESENEGEESVHENSTSSDEHDGNFSYPPLKLESSLLDPATKETNEPMPLPYKPEESSQGLPAFILSPVAPPSLSSKASSIVDQLDRSPIVIENDLSDSMDSTISFPSPAISQAMLPVSGSLVDLLVVLQRTCNFGHNLINLMLPENSTGLNSVNKDQSAPAQGRFDAGSDEYISLPEISFGPPHIISGSISDNFSAKQNLNRVSSPSARKRDMSTSDTQEVPQSSINQESSTSYKPNVNMNRDESTEKMQQSFYALKVRLSLHLRILKLSFNAMTIYTCNMLCMDLCGTPRSMARQMVGPKLLELAENLQAQNLIFGCRHQTETSFDCLHYPNHRSRYLNGRYEAVTQNMCTRINNIFACLQVVDEFKEKLSKVMKATQEGEEANFPPPEDENWNEFDSLWQDFSSLSCESDNSSSSKTQPPPIFDREKWCRALFHQWSRLVQESVNNIKCHILAVLNAMCRLLAHKLNLFVRDGLPLLLYLRKDNMSIPTLLERITSFLQKYFDALSDWLYSECFRRTLDSLWVLMVQDFEREVDTLKFKGMSSSKDAHTWLLAVSHLIKFMNNNGKGIKKDLLLAQAANAIFRLQLHTLPTLHLIALFFNLKEYYFEGDHLTLEEIQIHRPPSILHRIHHDLQSLRKCFSGAELMHWILKNRENLPADLPVNFGPDPKQSALILCQILMDQQFIVAIDFNALEHSTSPMSISSLSDGISPYPQLSIHSHTRSTPMFDDDLYSEGTNLSRTTSARSNRCHSLSSEDQEITEEDTETEHKDNVSVLSFRQTTPTREITLTADVHSPRDDDMESIDTSERMKVGDIGEESSSSPRPTSNQAFAPMNIEDSDWHNTNYNQNRNQLEEYVSSRTHKDSVTSEESCFIHVKSHTPFGSILTNSPPFGPNHFQPDPRKFYFVHQNALTTGVTPHNAPTGHAGSATTINSNNPLSDFDRALLRIRYSKESQGLVEESVMHKVSSMSLLSIIASRKRADRTAKEFLGKLPSALRKKVCQQVSEPIIDCRSS